MDIRIVMRAVDGASRSGRYKSLAGAAKAVRRSLGFIPSEGYRAVSNDGICVVSIYGASFADLDPAVIAASEFGELIKDGSGYVVKMVSDYYDDDVRLVSPPGYSFASAVAAEKFAAYNDGDGVSMFIVPLAPFVGPEAPKPAPAADPFLDDIPF